MARRPFSLAGGRIGARLVSVLVAVLLLVGCVPGQPLFVQNLPPPGPALEQGAASPEAAAASPQEEPVLAPELMLPAVSSDDGQAAATRPRDTAPSAAAAPAGAEEAGATDESAAAEEPAAPREIPADISMISAPPAPLSVLMGRRSEAGRMLADTFSPGARALTLNEEAAAPAQNDNPFLILFPELKTMRAPDWLKEGLRVTYYAQSATVAQDPDEGSGGAGYVQYDQVALDRKTAVASVKFYLDTGNDGVMPNTVTAQSDIPGAGAYWIHPDVLQDAERVAFDGLVVVKMPVTLRGKTYNAVRFQWTTEDTERVWMFEEGTGLLLFYRHAIGAEDAPRRQLADVTLVQRRQLDLPWQGARVPAWARAGASLAYEGDSSVSVGNGAPTPLPFRSTVKITAKGARYGLHNTINYISGRQSGASGGVTGLSQMFDALWLPPEALEALADGVIDKDPITRATITAARGADGRITLTEQGQAYSTALTFDGETGILTEIRTQQKVGVGIIRTVLELVKGP